MRTSLIRTTVASLLLMLVLPTTSVRADLGQVPGRATQFAFIIDDSGSMRYQTKDGPAADPDRLAVFATRSLMSALDDREEATIVRLNGPNQNEPIPPIMQLVDNRQRLESMLALEGPLAGYQGNETPCKSALEATKQKLNAAFRPDAMQVAVFMSDGACSGGEFSAPDFLKNLKSHEAGQFQFYLLRWRGRPYSKTLVELADLTGGIAVEVGATDPNELLQPLASVLSRSQGYESYMLSPRSNKMGAHIGARRIRLLAVAPDLGQDLKISLTGDAGGAGPTVLGAARSGLHQFEGGNRYRYTALDYRPGSTPVTVSVTGAGPDWRVIALPEYRLHSQLKIMSGECLLNGPEARVVEVGTSVCVAVELVNEENVVVTQDVAGPMTRASVTYRAPGGAADVELPASRKGDAPVFVLERANVVEGDHVFTPAIRLGAGAGEKSGILLPGPPKTLQAASLKVELEPKRLDLGDLLPGTEQNHQLKIDGNFPPGKGKLVVDARKDLPSCLIFTLNGTKEGELQPISPGQSYNVGVKVLPYCGPELFRRDLETSLRIEFQQASADIPLPKLVLPVHLVLINDLKMPSELTVTVLGGESGFIELQPEGSLLKQVAFDALLPDRGDREGWPPDADELQLAFIDDAEHEVWDGEVYASSAPATFGKGPDGKVKPMKVRVESDACCNGGSYKTEMALVPKGSDLPPIRVPLTVNVQPAGFWACHSQWIIPVLWFLLGMLILWYLFSMYQHSEFIERELVRNRLAQLKWNDYGDPVVDTNRRDCDRAIMSKLRFGPRLKAWLRANPLVFGLPGKAYRETLALTVSSKEVRGEFSRHRETQKLAFEKPGEHTDRLYIDAGGQFFFVPRRGSLQGYKVREPRVASESDNNASHPKLASGSKVVLLTGDPSIANSSAGWRLGS
jgi:hypothetical protein